MITSISRALPSSLIRFIGRLRFSVPCLAPLIQYGARRMFAREGVIADGVGKGLRFDVGKGRLQYFLGTIELEQQYFLEKTLGVGDIVYDIGANIGFITVLAAKLVCPSGHVYAFDPFPDHAKSVRRNAYLNSFDHVTVIESAVSDKKEQLWFNTVSKDASTYHLSKERTAAGFMVTTVVIDKLIEEDQLAIPTLVKIDVEGAEIRVLSGMMRTIRKHHPTIQCEVHWLGQDFTDFWRDNLKPLGYSLETIEGGRVPTSPVRYQAVLSPGTS